MYLEIIRAVNISLIFQYPLPEDIQLIRHGQGRRQGTEDYACAIEEEVEIEFLRRHFIELLRDPGSPRRLCFAELYPVSIGIGLGVDKGKEGWAGFLLVSLIAIRLYIQLFQLCGSAWHYLSFF